MSSTQRALEEASGHCRHEWLASSQCTCIIQHRKNREFFLSSRANILHRPTLHQGNEVYWPYSFLPNMNFSLNVGVTKPWQRGHGWSLPVGWLSLRQCLVAAWRPQDQPGSMLRLFEAPGVATPLPKPGRSRISIYCTEAWTVCLCQDFMNAFIKNIKENVKLDSSVMWNVPCTTTDCATFEFPFSFYFWKNGFWGKNFFLIRKKEVFISVFRKGLSFGKAIVLYLRSKWCINGFSCTFP